MGDHPLQTAHSVHKIKWLDNILDGTLPNEIWLEIFKRIDRPKLMELRLVCHHFYVLIEEILNKSPEWKDVADNAILFECLTLTMQRAHPYDLVRHMNEVDDPVMWRGTYLSFKKWQKVLENSYTKQSIVPSSTFGEISCVCTFDKYIAIAFENGSIANYIIEDGCLHQPFYVANHNSKVIQIEFWYSNGKVLVVTVGEDNALKFWDLKNKVEIATNGLFASSISSGECRHFCIGEMGGVITCYERLGKHITAGPTIDFRITEDEQVITHAIDGKNMSALSYSNGCTIMYLYHGVIEDGSLTKFRMDQEKDRIRVPRTLNASLTRLVMPTITFFFAIGAESIGSTNYYEDEWHEYKLTSHFGCNVTSIALHAQILMFGLEDGSINLLHIEHYGDVMDLEEKIENSRRIEVDTVPILDITVLEVEKKPCIVVITEERVHLINFF